MKKSDDELQPNKMKTMPKNWKEYNDVYIKVWNWSKYPTSNTTSTPFSNNIIVADTAKLSSLLMTSRLSTDTLGFIWSLTNRQVAGFLTQSELYDTLALVALAQKGYTFVNISILNQFSQPPIPTLDLSLLQYINIPKNDVANTKEITPTSVTSSSYAVPTLSQKFGFLSSTLLDRVGEPQSNTNTLSQLSPIKLFDSKFGDFQVVAPVTTAISNELHNDALEQLLKSVSATASNINTSLETKTSDLLSMESPPPKKPVNETQMKLSDFLNGLDNSSRVFSNTLEDEYDDFKSADFSSLNFNSLTINEPVNLSNDISVISDTDSTKNRQINCKISIDHPTQDPPVLDLFPKCSPKIKENNLLEMDNEISLTSKNNDKIITEDRYSALRILDTNEEVFNEPEKLSKFDDFGDFLTADVSQVPVINKEKCLIACMDLMKKSGERFQTISDDTLILNEVTGDKRCQKYLQAMYQVYNVGKRLCESSNDKVRSRQLNDLWDKLSNFIEADDKNIKEIDEFAETKEHYLLKETEGEKCAICSKTFGPCHVRYGLNTFHSPCANFYLHFVEPCLPITPSSN